MNLADYLSELLSQQDEVSVPGLGYFVRTRVNAFYNESEGRFYPPYHQVKFVAQPREDDTFAQYVADKKNISLASSKYFVEKFITKLREDASRGKYLFADLGSFQMDLDQLVFKPNERIPADPAFYGYPPVDIYRPVQPSPAEVTKPALAADQPTMATPAPPLAPPPPRAVHTPDYYEEEVEEKKRTNIWLIILIIVAVLGLAAFAVYRFYPSAFDKVKDEFNKLTGQKAEALAVVRNETKPVKKDTLKNIQPVKDSAVKTVTTLVKPAAKPDSLKLPQFEAVVAKTASLKKANDQIDHLHSLGFDAYLVQNAPGMGILYKVSVGRYSTWPGADSVLKMLIKQRVIAKSKNVAPLEVQPL